MGSSLPPTELLTVMESGRCLLTPWIRAMVASAKAADLATCTQTLLIKFCRFFSSFVTGISCAVQLQYCPQPRWRCLSAVQASTCSCLGHVSFLLSWYADSPCIFLSSSHMASFILSFQLLPFLCIMIPCILLLLKYMQGSLSITILFFMLQPSPRSSDLRSSHPYK